MSEKHFCDGCDVELFLPGEIRNFKTSIFGTEAAFDLCTSCVDRLKNEHLPRRWPRPEPLPRPTGKGA